MGEYEVYGYKLCFGMKDNFEFVLFMNKEVISNVIMNFMESLILV